MALRKLTTQEKVKLLGYSTFVEVLELDAMEEAKKLSEAVGTEAKLTQHCNNILANGGMANRQGFCRTWLVYFNNNVEIVENQNDGMQLRETIEALLLSNIKNTTIAVLTKQAESIILPA